MATSLSLSEFRTQFPEFGNLPDALVSQRLSWAHDRLDSTVWGDYRSIGAGFLTAHFCAMSPRAEDMRLKRNKGEPYTFYELEFNRWVRIVAGGARIAATANELSDLNTEISNF